MGIREFDGELDNPNIKEFTGELDPEPGLLDPLYKAANKLFKVGSVMDGAPAVSSGAPNPANDAMVQKILAEQAEKMRPSLSNSNTNFVDGPAGIAEVAARRGVAGLREAVGGAAMAAGDAFSIPALSEFGTQTNEAAKAYGQGAALKAGNVEGFSPDSIVQELPQAAANAGASIIQTAPGLIANVAVPGSGLPLLFSQVGAQEYGQGVEAGLTGPGAALRAIPMGAAEVIGEKLGGFNTLTSGIRQSVTDNSVEPLARALLQSAAREVPGEELTTTLQFLTDKAPGIGTNQDATLADYTKAVKDTALATLLQSGGMATAGVGLQAMADRSTPTSALNTGAAPAPEQQPLTPAARPVKKDVSELSNAIASTASIPSGNIVEVPDDIELDQPNSNSVEIDGIKTQEPITPKANEDDTLGDISGDLPRAPSQPDMGIPISQDDHIPDVTKMVDGEIDAPEIDLPAMPASSADLSNQNMPLSQSGAALMANSDGNDIDIAPVINEPVRTPENGLPQPKAILDKAMQLTTATAGLRPGDIVSSEGAPFATKQLAQKVKKDAGPGWVIKRSNGGFVVRNQPQTPKQIAATKARIREASSVDKHKDSMFAAIAKLGGISTADVKSEWGISDDLKGLRGAGIKRVATDSGMSVDAMGEALAELGYLSVDEHGKYDMHEFEDLFGEELGGSKHFTPEGFENKAQEDHAQAYEDHLSEQNIKDSGYDELSDGQNDIEDTLNEYPESDAEIEERLEREGRELDAAGFGSSLERENEDEIPFSAKGSDGRTDKTTSGATTEQNSAERTGNVGESAGNDRPEFELATHDKTDLAKRARLAEQEEANALASKKDENATAASISDFKLTGSDRAADVGASRGQASLFSKNKQQSGLSVDQVREAIANDSFGQEVDVYATLDDAPDYVKDQAKSEGAIGVEGFFDSRTGRVALIAENLESAERAVQVARHELIGHYGLEGMVGKEEMGRLARRVIQAEKEGNKTFAEVAEHVDRTQPGLSPERRAKEIIAVMAERNMQNSIVLRVIDAIRKFLNSIGFKQELTDAEVSALLRDAQAYLRDNGRSMIAGEPAAMFSASESELEKKLDAAGIDHAISEGKGKLTISKFVVAKDRRGQGEGTKAMQDVIDYADSKGLTVTLTPSIDFGGSSVDRLKKFYKQFGFVENKGKSRDFSISDTMYREPGEAAFSAKGSAQAGLNLKPEGIKAKDFISVEKDKVGRKQSVAGRKIYDKIANVATDILGKVKLADNAPDSFKKIMREYRVDQTKAQANAKNVAKIGMAQLDADERKMLSDIIEGYTKVGDMTPESVVEIAASIQAALHQQGEDLVELGMISRDRLIKNYLPRAYRNPLLARFTNKDIFKSWYQKSRLRITGARLKSRGLVHEIKAGEWAKYKRLNWKLGSMSDGSDIPADLVEAIKLNKEIPPHYPADLKFIVWRDFTMDEREKMGEIHDGLLRYALGYVETQKDIAIGRLFTAIANNRELSSKINPGGWAQVPDREIPGADGVKQFGALSGMYVPDYVKDQIERNTQPKGPLMAAYDTALNFWKEGKTVWNPVAHGNNIISNVFTAHFAGLNVADPRVWHNTAKQYRTKGNYYQEAVDSGLFGTEWASIEIQEMFMPDIVGEADIETVTASRFNKVVNTLKKAGKPVSFYREKMQAAYQFEDQFFKLMMFIDRRKNGASIEDSINDTERYIFNYADVPEGVQVLKRTYSPFISYTYKALPMLVHTALTRPDRLIAPIALLGGANWLAYAMIGGDEDEERKNMPEYMKGNTAIGTPKSVRMPFNVGDRPAFMDMSRRVPLGDLFDMNNQTGGMEVPAPMMPSHPLFTATAALMFNKDTFSGKDVTKASDTDWEVAQKRADWIFKQIVPNAPFIPGSWNFDKLMNGTANAFDTEMMGYTGYTKAGDATPLGMALLDVAGGTKIRSFDPARNKDFKEYEIDKERKEVKANIRSAMRNQAMPSDKRESYIADQREKMQELTRKRQGL